MSERAYAGYIRFSYANSVDNIREAIKRIAALLRARSWGPSMYEEEITFLAAVEDRTDQTNRRRPLDSATVERIRQTFLGIPEDYLAYLREVGPGSARECQYAIYEAPSWCDEEPLFSWFESRGRKLLIIGDDFSGDLFALDTGQNYRVAELLHETMEVLPFGGGFREFIRGEMLLGPNGTDQRASVPKPSSP